MIGETIKATKSTISQIADAAGISRQSLTEIIAGRSVPNINTFRKIILALREVYQRSTCDNSAYLAFLRNPLELDPFPPDEPNGKPKGGKGNEIGKRNSGGDVRGIGNRGRARGNNTLRVSGECESRDAKGGTKVRSQEVRGLGPDWNSSDSGPDQEVSEAARKASTEAGQNSFDQFIQRAFAVLERRNASREILPAHEGVDVPAESEGPWTVTPEAIADPAEAARVWYGTVKGKQQLRKTFLDAALRTAWGAQRAKGKDVSTPQGWAKFGNCVASFLKARRPADLPPLKTIERDEDLAEQKARLADYMAGFINRIEKEEHSKGAYQQRRWGDRRPTLLGLMELPEFRDAVRSIMGRDLKVFALEKIYAEHYGGASMVEQKIEAFSETEGFQAGIAGRVWMMDATGLPVKVRGDEGAKHWLHVGCDIESAYSLLYTHCNHIAEKQSSENAGWDQATAWMLAELGYAPERVICDRVSGLFAGLDRLQAGAPPLLSAGVLAWLLADTQPMVHAPKRATAKGQVESAVRISKGVIKQAMVARAIAQEMRLGKLQSYRQFETAEGWYRLFETSRAAMNAKKLVRANCSRLEKWLGHAESVAWRETRKLKPELIEDLKRHAAGKFAPLLMDMVARCQVGEIAGRWVRVKKADGRSETAEILGALKNSLQEMPVLCLPSGMLESDADPDLFRLVAVEQRAGQNVYHKLNAQAVAKTFFGLPVNKPMIGQHPVAVPDTKLNKIAKKRDGAAEQYLREVAERRKGMDGAMRAFNGGESITDISTQLSETGS